MKISKKPGRLAGIRGLTPLIAAASALVLVPLEAGTFSNNFDTDPGAAVTLDGSATWAPAGYISLTENAGSLNGLMIVPDLDSGATVGGFTATFKLQIGPGSGNPADGFSFNWAADLPTSAGSVSEEGAGTGLTVAFDIYDNGGGEAPSIDVKVGGRTIAQHKLTKGDGSATDIMTSGFADVKIQYVNGLLNVDYKGKSIYTNLPTGLGFQTGAVFGFGARTGGESAAQYVDNLNITTVLATSPQVSSVGSNAKSLLIKLTDAPNGAGAVDPTSVTATIDNVAVTGSATKNGDITSYTFTNPSLYTAGSTHNVVLTYKYGTPATTVTVPLSFTVGAFTSLPASAALPAGIIDTTKRGFTWRVHQVDSPTALPNTLARTENQLGGLLGDNVADPNAVGGADGPSTAPSPSTAPIQYIVSNVINFKDAQGGSGSFTGDTDFPGIPGTTGSDDSIAGEVVTGIEFPAAGVYRLVVNSDDGFRTTAGRNPRDPSSPVLGFFEGGRGPADSPFEVYIDTPGIYPMRTIWEEGGGGAALEWFSESLDGTRALLNDTANSPTALRTYQIPASALPAYLGVTTPAAGSKTITYPSTIQAYLYDAGTTVTDGSVSLKVNGVNVPVVATRTGTQTKVVGTPNPSLVGNTTYTAELTYSDNTGPHTTSWTFTTGPLSTTLFTIEAEDFDYSDDGVTGGLHNPAKGTPGQDVDVMPYYGGAYDGKSAVLGVDYNDDDPADQGTNYRSEDGHGKGNDVSMYLNTGNAPGNGSGGNLPIAGNDRGTYTVTTTYELGWSGNDWFNYTREFPDNGKGGWWEVYIGLSYGGADPGQLSAKLSLVTDGAGTPTQTVQDLGTFSGPGSGNWGQNNLVPMRNASGGMAVVKLQGLQTVRASINSGDYDFLIFSAANPPPPFLAQAPQDSAKRDAAIFDWVIQDGGSLVNASTVQIKLNNQDVTSKATVTKTATGATIHLDLSGTLQPAGELPWTITFKDNSPTPQTVTGSGTVVVNPYPTQGVFVIEAEDFNYSTDDINGGLTNPQKGTTGLDVDVMPYLGGAYDLDPTDPTVGELSAIKGVDYNNADGNDSNVYRSEKDANGENEVNITASNGNRYSNDRGVYDVTSNYRIGWVGNGDWANYTRTFPTNDYTVWAALSYDGRGADLLRGSLDLVTSDPTKPNQTTQQLGTFDAGASGGWGRNELVPMKTNGVIATVHLGGVQTVRYNMPSGDFDYLLFVPQSTQPAGPQFTKYQVNANGSITIEWTGTGTLETTPSLTPNATWTPINGATSPFTFTPQPGVQMLFARIKQ